MTTDSPLRTRLRTALLGARRDRDAGTVSALRTAIAALENAEAVPAPQRPAGALEDAPLGVGASEARRRVLDEADELAVLDAEIEAHREAERAYAEVAPDRAEAARRAARTLTDLRSLSSG